MKICSLLPSATEILFALGLGDQVAGVSHECDFPPEARSKPVLIVSRISHTESAAAIDREVREFLERGESLYSVDLTALAAIDPDGIITQDLCHVCAATPDDLGAALAHLRLRPQIVTLNPHSLSDVCADIGTAHRALAKGCEDMPAVRNGRVFLVEASGYFSRPGPRLAAGVAILADALHAGQQASLTPSAAGLVLARAAAAGI